MGRLGRDRRLRVPAQFRYVFADPVRAGDANLLVLARSNGVGHARLGMAVAKRHLRRAVDRNRFKRITRESFRWHQEDLGGIDVVVLARRGAATADRHQLRASIDRQLRFLRRRLASRTERIGSHG